MRLATLLLLAVVSWAQEPEVFRIGNGVISPVPTHKPEPSYTDEARAAGVQGNVWIELRIDRQGLPRDLTVLSPLGFGLDEQAIAAIETWRFKPGTKDGQPVNVMATIQVTFRLLGEYFDKKAEERRQRYNVALNTLRRNDAKRRERSLKDLADLAKEKYAPGQYLYGQLLREGQLLPRDEARGEELVRLAAEQKYGPALWAMAADRLRQGIEPEKSRDQIHKAAILGSTEAQAFIAAAYESGSDGYAKNLDSAMQFYRLCATARIALCQYKMGRLLLDRPGRRERDWLQGLAWMELAADAGIAAARHDLQDALSKEQSEWVKRLKGQLVAQQ